MKYSVGDKVKVNIYKVGDYGISKYSLHRYIKDKLFTIREIEQESVLLYCEENYDSWYIPIRAIYKPRRSKKNGAQ